MVNVTIYNTWILWVIILANSNSKNGIKGLRIKKIGATLAIGPTARKTRARSSFSDVATCLPTPLATMGSYSTKLHDCLKMNKSTRSHTFVKLAKPLILPIHLGPIRPSPLNAWEWFPYITKFRKLCGESATMGHLQKSWPAVIFGRLGQCKT